MSSKKAEKFVENLINDTEEKLGLNKNDDEEKFNPKLNEELMELINKFNNLKNNDNK